MDEAENGQEYGNPPVMDEAVGALLEQQLLKLLSRKSFFIWMIVESDQMLSQFLEKISTNLFYCTIFEILLTVFWILCVLIYSHNPKQTGFISRQTESKTTSRTGGIRMIWEELNKSLIIIGMEADSCQDVFKQLGGAMIQEGYAKSSYIEALAAREKEYPTGLDIDGTGVAIPHTDVSHVNKAGIGIAVLKHPVTFIQMGTDDEEVSVNLVFMLSVIDPNAHIDELQKILAIIQDTAVLEQVISAQNAEKIIDIIKEKENSL